MAGSSKEARAFFRRLLLGRVVDWVVGPLVRAHDDWTCWKGGLQNHGEVETKVYWGLGEEVLPKFARAPVPLGKPPTPKRDYWRG
jgi:hypothetical protein